jgi:hypothetical protein
MILKGRWGGRVSSAVALQAGKAGEKAGFVAERRAGGVIGMARFPVRQNHYAGRKFAQDFERS